MKKLLHPVAMAIMLVYGIVALQPTRASQPEPEECPTLQLCLDKVREVADPGRGLTGPEQRVAQRLAEFGEKAVPDLVDMLADPDEAVATVAAAALGDVETIHPKFLPQIRVGLDRGIPWLPRALGRIGTEEAAEEAVKRYLAADSSPGNQEAYAIRTLGSIAIPPIVEAARCRQGDCDGRHYSLLGHALASVDADRTKAARDLFEIVRDAPTPEVARAVLILIADLGTDGLVLEEDLLELRRIRPEYSGAVGHALIGIRSSLAGEEFQRRLVEQRDGFGLVLILRDLAEVGSAGVSAGPAVAGLLGSAEPDVRVAAARAIGFIGYQDASHALAALLQDPLDARLGWAAAESLGRLQADAALGALQSAADIHWYPPVRKAAALAVDRIESRTGYPEDEETVGFPFLFYAYEDMGIGLENCESIALAKVPEAEAAMLAPSDDPALFEKLRLHVEGVSSPRSPDFVVPVPDGWLAGADVGEWGGSLVHFGSDGLATPLVEENAKAIHRVGDTLVLVTGLAHLSLNRGALYQLRMDPVSGWQARMWRRLPGAPTSSMLVESGELLVNGYGGSILVRADGSMRMAPCSD